jgi:hypothetical protein
VGCRNDLYLPDNLGRLFCTSQIRRRQDWRQSPTNAMIPHIALLLAFISLSIQQETYWVALQDSKAVNDAAGLWISTTEVAVLAPTPGEHLQAGTTYTIQLNETVHSIGWFYLANVINSTLFHLLPIGNVSGFGDNISTGGYDWKIPNSIPPGSKYVLLPFGTTDYYGISQMFTIESPDEPGSVSTTSPSPSPSSSASTSTPTSTNTTISPIPDVSPTPLPSSSSSKSSSASVIGGAVGGTLGGAAIILSGALVFLLRRRRARKAANGSSLSNDDEKAELDGLSSPRVELDSPQPILYVEDKKRSLSSIDANPSASTLNGLADQGPSHLLTTQLTDQGPYELPGRG